MITPVSIDHPEFLGATVDKIAYEKAGILKAGAPAVIAAQTDEALRVIEREALRLGVAAPSGGPRYFIRAENGRLAFEDELGLIDLPTPRLPGRHQFGNAAAAIAALRAVAPDLPHEAFERGLRGAMAGAAAAAARRPAGRPRAGARGALARRRPQRSGRPRARRGDGRFRGRLAAAARADLRHPVDEGHRRFPRPFQRAGARSDRRADPGRARRAHRGGSRRDSPPVGPADPRRRQRRRGARRHTRRARLMGRNRRAS